MSKQLRSASVISIIALTCTNIGRAAAITWTGGAGTNSWHAAGNWDLNRVPAAGDDVVVPDMTPNVTVTYSTGNTTISSLTSVEAFTLSGGTLTIDAASTLNGAFTFSGALSGAGDVTVNGAMTWTGNGAMSGSGKTIIGPTASLAISDPFQKTLNRTLENHSPNMNWTPGAGGNFSFNNGTLHNMSDGVFTINISSSNTMGGVGGTNALINAGTLNKTGAGTLSFNTVVSAPVVFNNSGTTNLDAGGLTISNGGTNTGTIDADAGTSLTFSSFFTHDDAASLLGTGTLTFSGGISHTIACSLSTNRVINIQGGTVNFNAPYTMTGTVNLSGTLSGSGDITVAGPMTWTGNATMAGTGTTIIAATGSLAISDPFAKSLHRTLENHSANATWTPGAGSSFSFNNGTLINAADGTFTVNLTSNNTLYTIFGTGGTNAVNNAGTLNKIGNGILELKTLSGFPVPFNNSGMTNLDAGGLLIASGGSNTGTIDADAGTTLTLASTVTLDPASALTGQGTLTFTNGASQSIACTLATNRIINLLGGTISFDAPYSIDGTINLTGGVLSGTGDITVNGTFNWTGSQMTGTGKTIIAPSGALAMTAGTHTLSRVLENHSPNATWTPGIGSSFNFNNGTLINAADGTFTASPPTPNTQFTFFAAGGTNAVNNAGTFNKIGQGILFFNSFGAPLPFNNSGTVNVDVGALTLGTGGSNTGIFDGDAGTTLTISSVITFDPTSSILGTGTLTFTNGADQTIACTLATNRIINILAGTISFNAPYTFTGTLNATGGTLSGSGDLTINGILNWTGSQMSGSGKTIIAPLGTLNMGPNSLTLSRVLENHSPNAIWTPSSTSSINFNNGTLINASDGVFTANPTTNNTIHNFFSNGGTNAVTNAGTFIKTGNGLLVFNTFSTGLPMTNTGTIRVSVGTLSLLQLTNFSGTTLTGGIYDVTSTLRFTGANIVTNAANIILDGPAPAIQNTGGTNGLQNFATNAAAGVFQVKNGCTYSSVTALHNLGQVILGPGDSTFSPNSIVNNGTFTKLGTGTANVTPSSQFTNGGTIDLQAGTMIMSTLANQLGATFSGGIFNIAGTLKYSNANIVNNEATIILDGPASAIQDLAGVNALGNILSNRSTGSLQIKNGRNLALPGAFTNLGQVRIGPGDCTLSDTGNYVQNAGATTLDGGTLDPTDLADISGGELKGNGIIQGHVRNSGTIKPGLSAGLLTINGDYQQFISGALEVELGGTTAGTSYDQLAITGNALLAGALRVLLINGFAPTVNDTFDILTAALAEVKFQTIQLPILPNLHGMRFVDLPDGLRLTVIDCGPGDADGDGVGDACDTPPDLTWHTIDGGGGVSSGGIFKLSATIGQPDACSPAAPMTGGIFTLVGGFWPGVEIVEVPECSLIGDMNGDGLRNGKDIQQFAGCVIGGGAQDCSCADINESGAADAADVLSFVQILLN